MILKTLGLIFVLCVLAVVLLFMFGLREPVDTQITFDPAAMPDDLDAYFAAREAQVPDITQGVQKRVAWFGAKGEKTPLAVLYVHGFSATSEEIRPVPDTVAQALGANLVFTRLTGHGRNGDAMAEATVNAWMQDMAEALEAARRVGDEVIVVSTSTGSTLSTIAAFDPALMASVKGFVFVSPNFGLNSAAATILTWPLVRHWGPWVAGERRSFPALNEAHGTYWSNDYPTVALMPMAAAVRHARGLALESLDLPLLVLMSDNDKVVSPDATREVALRWGGPVQREMFVMTDADDAYSHVIAGDILSPNQTDKAAQTIIDWARGL